MTLHQSETGVGVQYPRDSGGSPFVSLTIPFTKVTGLLRKFGFEEGIGAFQETSRPCGRLKKVAVFFTITFGMYLLESESLRLAQH